jgi:hypothetical protein
MLPLSSKENPQKKRFKTNVTFRQMNPSFGVPKPKDFETVQAFQRRQSSTTVKSLKTNTDKALL